MSDVTFTAANITWDEPTPHLKFIDGKLHQLFHTYGGPCGRTSEWRLVPSEDSTPSPKQETTE